jgi:ABC-type nitrate/sulfonate/bicarbonate transport system substrate-binding protein
MNTHVLRGLVAAVSLLALGASARAADVLHVGKAAATSSAILPVDVGVRTGIFAKHGLDVQISTLQGGGKMHQAMVAGSIDLGIGAGPEMALIAKGSPELAVCNMAPSAPFIGLGVPADSPIRKVAQLKGKKIGVSSIGGLTYWLSLELARTQGWGPHGISPVAIGNGASSVAAAIRTHAVDATMSGTSIIFNMEAKDEARLLIPVTKFVGNIGAGMIFATDQAMKTSPGAIRNFLAGWLETVAFMRKHRDEAIKIEAAVTHFSPAVQTKEFDLTIGMFNSDCKFDAESLKNLKRSFTDLKLVDAPPDMSKLYTEKFIPRG